MTVTIQVSGCKPESALPWARPLGEAERAAFGCAYPISLSGQQEQEHHTAGGKAGAVSGVPGPVTKLGSWGSQTLGHPGTAGNSEEQRNRVGSHGLWTASTQG